MPDRAGQAVEVITRRVCCRGNTVHVCVTVKCHDLAANIAMHANVANAMQS